MSSFGKLQLELDENTKLLKVYKSMLTTARYLNETNDRNAKTVQNIMEHLVAIRAKIDYNNRQSSSK
jgi:hypothetical protein